MNYSNKIINIFYVIASVWLGFIFITIFILLGYDIIRHIVYVNPNQAGVVIISVVGSLTTYGVVNAKILRVREVKLQAKGLRHNLRIAHLSDLHIGSIQSPRFLRRVVRKTKALNPDLVLITGDLADGPQRYNKNSFAILDEFQVPVFFSTGNHEYYAGLDFVMELLSQTKVNILRNKMVEVGNIQLIGIDDGLGNEMISKLLHNLNPNPKKYTILMYHRPVGLEVANKYGVNLMLSGHTHGGQFFPFLMFVRLVWKRAKGLYNYNGTYLYTTQGTGTWGPPLRLGTNSEITLVRLIGT